MRLLPASRIRGKFSGRFEDHAGISDGRTLRINEDRVQVQFGDPRVILD